MSELKLVVCDWRAARSCTMQLVGDYLAFAVVNSANIATSNRVSEGSPTSLADSLTL